jgi:hypothetical protein
MFTQSGKDTLFIQEDVEGKMVGKTLLDFLCAKHKKKGKDFWNVNILDGNVTIDGEIVIEPLQRVEVESFVEYIGLRSNIGTQTLSSDQKVESKFEEPQQDDAKLLSFLKKTTPLMTSELQNNLSSSKALFENFDFSSLDDVVEDITYWKVLTVDLEKHKVVFPDWTNAKHFPGVILNSSLTRNKERVYSIDYEDGVVLTNVREEYVRVLIDNDDHNNNLNNTPNKNNKKNNSNGSNVNNNNSNISMQARLQEGVRVHAKVKSKSNVAKYYPGVSFLFFYLFIYYIFSIRLYELFILCC